MLRRRDLLSLGLGAAAWPMIARAEENPSLVATARKLLEFNRHRIPYDDLVALADYGAPSWRPRLHLVDLRREKFASFLVAHGRGSDPNHTGWLKTFSNDIGSNASSFGAYRTGDLYEGKYGRSMRLEGLDDENSNAERRAIVIHPAWYVADDMIARHGKLGRSEGCFALSEDGLRTLLDQLGPGRLLYAGRF